MIPLLLHLMFHPASETARQRARELHKALNADSSLPNLSIPTRILTEDGSGLPPREYSFNEAEHNVAIVFADDQMALERDIPRIGALGPTSWWISPSAARMRDGGFSRYS
jgi:hypothetical protein